MDTTITFTDAAARLRFEGSVLELAHTLAAECPQAVRMTRSGVRVDISQLAGSQTPCALPEMEIFEAGVL